MELIEGSFFESSRKDLLFRLLVILVVIWKFTISKANPL